MSIIEEMAKKHKTSKTTMYRRYNLYGIKGLDKPKYPRGEMRNIYKRVNRFRVKIAVNRKIICIGSFATLEEAKNARDKFRAENGMEPIGKV